MGLGRIGMGEAGWPTDRRVRRLTWFGCLLTGVAAVVAVFAVIFYPSSHTGASAPARATHPATERAMAGRSASYPPVTWQVAGPVEGVDQLISHHMSERVELVRAAKADRRYAISGKVVDLRIRSNRICHRLPPTADGRVGERLSRGRGSAGGRVVTSLLPRTHTTLAAYAPQNSGRYPQRAGFNCAIVAGRRLMSPGPCLRWLPRWLPETLLRSHYW